MTGEEYAKAKQVKAARKRYDARVAEHRCVTCGAQDERTLAGRTRCAACYAKAYKWPQRATDESRKSAALKKREFRAAMKAEGRCMNCGAQDYLTLRGKPLCVACQRRRNRQQKDYRESGGMSDAGTRGGRRGYAPSAARTGRRRAMCNAPTAWCGTGCTG